MCKDKAAVELLSRVLREHVIPLQGRTNDVVFKARTIISDIDATDYNMVQRVAYCKATLYTKAPKEEVDLEVIRMIEVDYAQQSDLGFLVSSRFIENGEREYAAPFDYTVQVTKGKELLVAVTRMHDLDARMSAAFLVAAGDVAAARK